MLSETQGYLKVKASLSELVRIRGFQNDTILLLEQAAESAAFDMDEAREIDEGWLEEVRALTPKFRAIVEQGRDAEIASLRAQGAHNMDVDLAADMATAHIVMFDRFVKAALRMMTGTLEREIDAEVRTMRVKDALRRAIDASN